MRRSPRPGPQALLTVRSALVLGISFSIGVLAAALMLIGSGSGSGSSSSSLAAALLVAGAVTAGSIGLLDQIIGDDTGHSGCTGQENDGTGRPR